MSNNKRWMKNIITEAKKTDTVMPWARGKRRAEWIAKRNSGVTSGKAAAA